MLLSATTENSLHRQAVGPSSRCLPAGFLNAYACCTEEECRSRPAVRGSAACLDFSPGCISKVLDNCDCSHVGPRAKVSYSQRRESIFCMPSSLDPALQPCPRSSCSHPLRCITGTALMHRRRRIFLGFPERPCRLLTLTPLQQYR